MSGGFGTQPDDLDAASRRFDEAADGVAAALSALRSTLGGLGDYLGPDEQGRAFAAEYDPTASEGLMAIGREADALRSVGAALRASAQAFREGDEAGSAQLRRPGAGPP